MPQPRYLGQDTSCSSPFAFLLWLFLEPKLITSKTFPPYTFCATQQAPTGGNDICLNWSAFIIHVLSLRHITAFESCRGSGAEQETRIISRDVDVSHAGTGRECSISSQEKWAGVSGKKWRKAGSRGGSRAQQLAPHQTSGLRNCHPTSPSFSKQPD